jgi:3',5'-cyclic-AMP phosphodiesterase
MKNSAHERSLVWAHSVSWRFKPLRTSWPFVMITSPSDHRLVTDLTCPTHVVSGEFTVAARVFGADESTCHYRVNGGPWEPVLRATHSAQWEGRALAPADQFTLSVEATDLTGHTDTDKICVATPGFRPPDRAADGSDADALDAWPERHLLGTRLGPNRNGRQW